MLNEQDENDSDDEDDEQSKKFIRWNSHFIEQKNLLDQPVLSKDEQEKVNDDLLYDPDEEEEDEKWMTNQRLKYIYLFFFLFSFRNFLVF